MYDTASKRTRTQNVRLNPLDYGRGQAVELSASDKFRTQSYIPVIYQYIVSLSRRIEAYDEVSNLFSFLSNIMTLSEDKIREHASKLIEFYRDDVDKNLSDELIEFRTFAKTMINEEEVDSLCFEAILYKILVEKNLVDLFPNVEVILRIYLTLMTTNCTSERAFSKLKNIKTRLRSCQTAERTNDLAILGTENDLLKRMSISNIIKIIFRRRIVK